MTTTTPPTLTAGEAAAAARIRHASRCPRPDYRATVGSRGDKMVRCRCGRFVVTDRATPAPRTEPPTPDPTPTPTPEPVDAPAPILARTRYVCRTHGRAVTWKGRGCVKCAAELAGR